jgi:hypothetical protein
MMDFTGCIPTLTTAGLMPEGPIAVYVGGSAARGWDNASSDVDIYIVTEEKRAVAVSQQLVMLEGGSVPVEVLHVDGRRWDVEYWQPHQILQLMDKVSWQRFDTDRPAPESFLYTELEFMQRLPRAVALMGEEWLTQIRAEFAASALRAMMITRSLDYLDILTEDALGQLEAGDTHSAVLAAKLAIGAATDAVLAGQGEFGGSPKWRARRMEAASPALLSFAEFWDFETMRHYDAAQPQRWVERVLRKCQFISQELIIE